MYFLHFSTLIWTCLYHFFCHCCYMYVHMLCPYMWMVKIFLDTHGVHTFITQMCFSFSWWVPWEHNDLIHCDDLLEPKNNVAYDKYSNHVYEWMNTWMNVWKEKKNENLILFLELNGPQMLVSINYFVKTHYM